MLCWPGDVRLPLREDSTQSGSQVWGNCHGGFPVSFHLVLKTSLIYIIITDLAFKVNLWGKSCRMINFWLWSAATRSSSSERNRTTMPPPQNRVPEMEILQCHASYIGLSNSEAYWGSLLGNRNEMCFMEQAFITYLSGHFNMVLSN